MDQHDILQVFTNEFSRRFMRDLDATPLQAISMSRDISIVDND